MFAAVGREYLILIRDHLNIPVSIDPRISAFKMQSDEQIVFRFCHKPPMADGRLWADVQQLQVDSGPEQDMALGWEEPPVPPDYAIADLSMVSGNCALNEIGGQCAADPYLRQVELADPVRPDPNHGNLAAKASKLLTAKAQGRTFRGGRLWVGDLSDYVLALDIIPNDDLVDAGGIGIYLRTFTDTWATWQANLEAVETLFGRDIKFTPTNYYDFHRWRYGYNHDCRANKPCAWHRGGYSGWHEGPDPTLYQELWPATQRFENGTRTITPVMFPAWCLDPEHISRFDDYTTDDRQRKIPDGTQVMLHRCDGSQFQDWVWTGTLGGETADAASGQRRVMNVATGMCLGIGSWVVRSGTPLALYSCVDAPTQQPTLSVQPTYAPTTTHAPTNGCQETCFGTFCSYWVNAGYSCSSMENTYGCDCSDCGGWWTCPTPSPTPAPSLDNGGQLVEWNELFFEPSPVKASHGQFHFDPRQGPYEGVTWNRTTRVMPFNEANVSQLSVLVAGNTSLQVSTGNCQKEGCPEHTSPQDFSSRNFRWSCGMACWNVTGNEDVDVPTTMGITTIWDDWTVTLDVRSVVLNRLTIRGRLYFMPDAGGLVELRCHHVQVHGGALIMGNHTNPILPNTLAILTLHSDTYMQVMNQPVNYNTRIYNYKRLDINGNFSAVGSPVTTWRRLGAHAFAGEKEIVLEHPGAAGWRVGDSLIITSSRQSKAGGDAYEYHTIANITETIDATNGSTRVSLVDALAQSHIGEIVNLTSAQQGYGNISVVDMRSAVGHLTRNVRINGGTTNRYDQSSGVDFEIQQFGGTIKVRDECVARG